MRRLPPLTALRAFEAAARHISFTRAAAELCVTQAAISQQVRQLEEWLGSALFLRAGHALRLTDKGQAWLPELTAMLDRLSFVSSSLRERDDGPLRITVLPSFATCWLVPRLGAFREMHPDIELKLTSSGELWDVSDDRFDVGIRSGLGRWRGLKADLIAREMLSPLCSPSLQASDRPLMEPADLLAKCLLHDTPKDAWPYWFTHVGVMNPNAGSGPKFDDHSHVLQAAIDGQGVALGKLLLAGDALRAGRLVQPFSITQPNDYSYWLVYPASAVSSRPDVAVFRAWLLNEAKRCSKEIEI